jgi:peroxiredoxin
MTIQTGDKLPDASFTVMTSDGPAPRTTSDIFAGRKVVLFAVPGAFTPTCHRNHLPGFVTNAEAIKAKGIDAIAVTAVNDVFVMNAWSEASGGKGVIDFLADGAGKFAKALGLDMDLSEKGLGLRSKRYAMIVNDGTIEYLAVEEAPGQAEASGAQKLMEALA